jgi:hypothetical protein
MRDTLRTLWNTNRLLVIAFTIALSLTIVFGVRTTAFYVYWSTHRDLPVEGWMPAGYVARSHHVDVEVVREALGLEPGARDRRPIARIAADRGVPVEELVRDVNKALAEARAGDAQSGQ